MIRPSWPTSAVLDAGRLASGHLSGQPAAWRPHVGPARLLGFRPYFEAIIPVASVQVDGHPGLFNYLPNLYLTNRAAELPGVWLYRFAKRMGQISMGNADYSVATPDGAPVWSARYQQPGFARPLTDSPDCARVLSICDQVIVTQGKFSRWQFVAFDFQLGTASIAPVSTEITIRNAALAQLPEGVMTARPLAFAESGGHPGSGLPGAFRIRTSWTPSNPMDSGRIARLVAARTGLP